MHRAHRDPRRRLCRGTASVAGALLASAAGAQQTYSIQGGLWGSAGRSAPAPLIGQTLCNASALGFARGGHSLSPATTPAVTTTVPGPRFGAPSWNPAVATQLVTDGNVTPNGGLGGAFTIPPFLFRRDPPGMLLAISVPGNPAILQAATSARWRIPHSVRAGAGDAIGIPAQPGAGGNPTRLGPLRRMPANCTLGGPGGPGSGPGNPPDCSNLAPLARFHRSAWRGGPSSSFPGQTGRAGADFTFCPHPDNVSPPPGESPFRNCTQLGQADPDPLLVKYRGGPRGFGGTLNQLVDLGSPGGSLAVGVGGKAAFLKLDASTPSIRAGARGYADFSTERIGGATRLATSYQTGPVMIQGPGGGCSDTAQVITAIGATTAVAGQPPPIPTLVGNGGYRRVYNFPLTTGTVIARAGNVGGAAGTPYLTLTAMGLDAFTSGGARNIQLVGASLAHLTSPPSNDPNVQQMFLSLPEPGPATGLLAGAAALLGLLLGRTRPGPGRGA